jgi:type VI secretion system protein ImpL
MAEARPAGNRRVPQWVYLRNLFAGILLADRVGSAAAQANVKVSFARRVVLVSVAIVSLMLATWWTVSYLNNQNLVRDAVAAAKSVPAVGLASGQMASLDSLQKLSKVRQTLAVLNDYQLNGAPLSYRALLYKGNDIRQPLRTVYYALFRRLLLQPTQQTLIQITSNPGSFEAQGYSGYQTVYNALKAYLISTNHHEKQWTDFVPVLDQHWKQDHQVESARDAEAVANFAFYEKELPDANPYPQYANPDKDAVDNARAFLNKFPLEDSIYRAMLDTAGDKLKPIIFNRDYPGTEETVRNNYRVDGWFTKPGYINFQKELQNPNSNLNREEWVLGPVTEQNVDKAKIMADLKVRYDQDYVKTWREFLAATNEAIPYGDYVRAATVLEKLGGPQSALMQLFCVASENTSVPKKEVADAFQPAQMIAPAGCMRQLISPAAKPYVEGLGNLSNALKAIGPTSNPNEAAATSAKGAVSNALTAETSLVTGFPSDPTDPKATVLNKSQSLLKDPIERVDPTLDGINGAALNGQAGGMCAAINPLFRKYPFNPNSKEDASLAEVNDALNPQSGKLWAFVKSGLAPYVQQVGSDYIATTGQAAKITPAFLGFLNRAAHMSQAIYHGDAAGAANMTFTIQALPSQDVDHVSLAIDGSTLSGDPKNKPSQAFTWPGSVQSFALQARFGGSKSDFSIVNTTGLWAAWHAVDRANRGAGDTLQWTPITPGEGPIQVNGHPLTVRFGLDAQSAQILRPQYFTGLSCPGKAVQ